MLLTAEKTITLIDLFQTKCIQKANTMIWYCKSKIVAMNATSDKDLEDEYPIDNKTTQKEVPKLNTLNEK
jgi:hypothetical protein